MRQKKDKIIIVALSSLALFSSSLALMLYLKKDKIVPQNSEQKVVVYVSKKNLKKGTLIKQEDLKKRVFQKSYISFSPLMKEEIVGKYTKVEFLKDEPFRKEKLTLKGEKESLKNSITINNNSNQEFIVKNDSVSLSLNLFKNIDYTLKSGDYIDIVSVQEIKKGKDINFKTRYIALHVKILAFLKNGDKMPSYQTYILSKNKKQKIFADTILLDMPPRDIKNLFVAYYTTQELNSKRVYSSKGNVGHLWMIKTKKEIDNKIQKAKDSLLLDKNSVKKVSRRRRTNRKTSYKKVVISYEKE